ncbi:hypothetical protein [Streptomyces sp. NPDC006997]|uniref:hypothetical protein n=1 Tax=Streptomyces sp. NPDC006997 TaxID=3155356 RepID=UPI0033E75ACA
MTYTVVTLGPSGAGKTVYLAALWQVLRLQHERLCCYLTLDDPVAERRLHTTYQQVAGPGEWPLPTDGREFPEWVFSVKVSNQYGQFTAMRVRYIDYAGDRLTDPQEGSAEQQRLDDTLRRAHASLGLLDGRKVLEMMRGNADFLDQDMARVFGLLQDCSGPIHFVITKWDLLEGHYSLKQVRELLLKHPDFRALAMGRQNWSAAGMPVPPGRIRLIPISSVGRNFAVLGADGAMHKRANARPHPLNVDVGFAAVLPDLLASAVSAMREQERQQRRQRREAARAERDAQGVGLLRTATDAIATQTAALLSSTGFQVPVHALAAFLVAGVESATDLVKLPPNEVRKARRLQKTFRKRSVNAVRDNVAAAQFITHRMVDLLVEFERSPENDGTNLS